MKSRWYSSAWMKAGAVLGLVALVVIVSAVIYIKSLGIPKDASYVGSNECQTCHGDEHQGWHDSAHPKMMRRVDEPGAVVADLSTEGEDAAPFDPERAVWVIGSKWEQQFMGEENGEETLLPGSWLIGEKRWQRTGWDGWQVPQPLVRCHGCHTVGLNVETGNFVEPSVGCESCHGPGSWHVSTRGIGEIYSSLDAQVCGQCHTRGRSTNGKHFFPVDYRPGEPLVDYYNELLPSKGQNTSQWWGNGHAKKRHQEYYAWNQGKHANSLQSLKEGYDGRYGEVTSKCLSCHAGDAAVDDFSEHYKLDEVSQGVTCAVCHNSHGKLDKPRMACKNCHGEGASYHRPEINDKHIPCPSEAEVTCVDCHMPLTGKNGGAYTLHSHGQRVIPPEDTEKYKVPNSCANGGCHSDRDVEWVQGRYEDAYLYGTQ